MITDEKKGIDETLDKMPMFSQARWIALFEGVNIIADNAENNGKKFDNLTLKQPALEKYVESTCDGICKCLEETEKRRKINVKRKRRRL